MDHEYTPAEVEVIYLTMEDILTNSGIEDSGSLMPEPDP